MTLASGTRLGPYERGSALDLAERNAPAKSYENATVWRFPRRKTAIGPQPRRTQ
jgi:hypothetical protein